MDGLKPPAAPPLSLHPCSSTLMFVCYFSFQLYTKHAKEMGFDECHMFLRCVQFEFASFKENADQPPPLFITALQEDDTSIDRYGNLESLKKPTNWHRFSSTYGLSYHKGAVV